MESDGIVVVAGMGEVGRPLLRVLSRRFDCQGVDIQPVQITQPCSVLHVCYPFQIPDFIGTTAAYVEKYRPSLTIINSTVALGTTRKVQEAVGNRAVVFSPVRGKHARMETELLRYKKFIGAFHQDALRRAQYHFRQANFETATFRTPEVGELSKLVETTYLGILVAWTQEVERFAAAYDSSFDDVNAFIKEIDFLPSHIFPGNIGGHCVMPNISLLQARFDSSFLETIVESNSLKQQRFAARAGQADD